MMMTISIMIRMIISVDSCFRMFQVGLLDTGTTNIMAKRDILLLIHFLY